MIVRKTAAEIEKMRAAGRIVAEVLEALTQAIVPGVTRTIDLDLLAADLCKRRGAVPAFLGYRGYPAHTCISVNSTVVHGIPDELLVTSGDLVSIDFACSLDGSFADAAVTVPVGEVSPEARRLLAVTREALDKGIAQARIAGRIGDIGSAIQRHVERAGYSVVRDLVGHGVGRALHEDPAVPNHGKPGRGERLVEGMTLAIEPMVNVGGAAVEQMPDGWTIVTADRKLSAHFEHTVAITRRGPDILTLPGRVAAQQQDLLPSPVTGAAAADALVGGPVAR